MRKVKERDCKEGVDPKEGDGFGEVPKAVGELKGLCTVKWDSDT